MKIYVDTCVLSRLVDMNISERNLNALDKICEQEIVQLVTSQKTLDEFLNTSEDKRKKTLKILFKMINKVKSNSPTYEHSFGYFGGEYGSGYGGGGGEAEKKEFTILKGIFDMDDATHIFQALSNSCQYFLTLDEKTILKRLLPNMAELKKIAPNMDFGNPVDLQKKLNL